MPVSAPEKVTNLYDHVDISREEAQEMKERAFAGAFADIVEVEKSRSPESEIYGRSLSSMYRLGIRAARVALSEAIRSPEASQAKVEFYTSVEEGFGTATKLKGRREVRNYEAHQTINGKVMSKDPNRSVSDMTKAGLVCAEKKFDVEKAQGDYRFASQLIRTQWDHKNALISDAMVRGETDYNTRIVVTPFPEEAAALTGGEYWDGIGYVSHLRRGFVQAYFTDGEGGFIAGSLSFDGSNKHRLREIFHKHGVNIPEDEVTDNWLQYAITDTLTEAQAKALALEIANEADNPKYRENAEKVTNTVDITNEHRLMMEKAFNESYIHACESLARGCQTPEVRKLIFKLADKAEHFNERYQKALYRMRADGSTFTDDDMVVMHELLVFSTIEMMRALYIEKEQLPQDGNAVRQNKGSDLAYIQAAIDSGSFQEALSNFGVRGAVNNHSYSACGLLISLGGEDDLSDSPQSAFGGLDREKLSWHGGKIKKGKCVSCKKETKVGVENWCQKCIKC